MSYRVELIVGILALSIMAWLTLYPRIFRQRMLASQTKMYLIAVSAAATEFHNAHGRWPNSLGEIAKTDPRGNIVALKGATNDFWGHPFVFEPFDAKRGYGRVISLGADGEVGGQGRNHDIVYPFAEDQGKSLELSKSFEFSTDIVKPKQNR